MGRFDIYHKYSGVPLNRLLHLLEPEPVLFFGALPGNPPILEAQATVFAFGL